MVVYEVYYADVLIGHLQVENGLHQYLPDGDSIRSIQQKVFLLREMTEFHPWGTPIPFFDQMIRNNKRIGREKEIYYHNNRCNLRMIPETDFAAFR